MKILVVDNGTAYLRALLHQLEPNDVTVITRDELSARAITPVDVIVLSGGSSMSVIGHETEYGYELGLIRDARTPIIGICLGFELIAHAYKAKLERLVVKERGLISLKYLQPHPIFLGVPETCVFESHRWRVKEVSKPLVGLAKSKDGYEIISHESKLIFGFQFHPEMLPEVAVGDEIMRNCLNLIERQQSGDE